MGGRNKILYCFQALIFFFFEVSYYSNIALPHNITNIDYTLKDIPGIGDVTMNLTGRVLLSQTSWSRQGKVDCENLQADITEQGHSQSIGKFLNSDLKFQQKIFGGNGAYSEI